MRLAKTIFLDSATFIEKKRIENRERACRGQGAVGPGSHLPPRHPRQHHDLHLHPPRDLRPRHAWQASRAPLPPHCLHRRRFRARSVQLRRLPARRHVWRRRRPPPRRLGQPTPSQLRRQRRRRPVGAASFQLGSGIQGHGNTDQLHSRGRIQVGVGEARSRKTKTSVSVHVAGPRGPAGARQSPFRVLIVGFVSREL
jgi:hypothetical protein